MDITIEKRTSRSSLHDDFCVVASFLAAGLVSGIIFAWLVSRAELQRFWFLKGDKFLIPRYTYWVAFSFILAVGFASAYGLVRWRQWLVGRSLGSSIRAAVAGITIIASAPMLYCLTPFMHDRLDFNWELIVAPVMFVVLLSFSLCLFSAGLRLLPLAFIWNAVFVVAGLAFVYAVASLSPEPGAWAERVQWPIFESMIGVSFGGWVIWRERIAYDRRVDGLKSSRSVLQSCG
jgi:hypothetical protein